MTKIPSNSELCKLDNKNQKDLRYGRITKTVYNKRRKKIHGLWSKQNNEVELLKKLIKQKKRKAR
jgi:hypothetical protein